MAYRLSCTGCGGTVTADDGANRRGLAVCSQCNTILRITSSGPQPEPNAFIDQKIPDGVEVERHGPGNVAIRARKPKGCWTINRRTTLVGWSTGLLVGGLLASFVAPILGLCGVAAGVAAFVASARWQRDHRPLHLKRDQLIPSDEAQSAIAVEDVQQIYAAVCHIDLGGDSSCSSANVFALTHKGERILLMGPMESEAAALYTEQVLETEIRLFNLSAMGEASQPDDRDADFDETSLPTPTAPMVCEGCGSTVVAGEAGARRGIVECSHCFGLSLLHEAGDETSALDSTASGTRCYEIDEEVDGLSILPLEASRNHGSLEVLGDRIVLRKTGAAPLTVSGRDLGRIGVKRSERSEQELEVQAGIQEMASTLALSGDVDLDQLLLGADGATSFRVVAPHAVQGEVELIGGVRDPREAFLVARTLTRVLAKSA